MRHVIRGDQYYVSIAWGVSWGGLMVHSSSPSEAPEPRKYTALEVEIFERVPDGKGAADKRFPSEVGAPFLSHYWDGLKGRQVPLAEIQKLLDLLTPGERLADWLV